MIRFLETSFPHEAQILFKRMNVDGNSLEKLAGALSALPRCDKSYQTPRDRGGYTICLDSHGILSR